MSIRLSQSQFNAIREYLMEVSGLHLKDDKLYLVEQRIPEVLKSVKLDSVDDLIQTFTVSKNSEKIKTSLISTLNTHETSFFRDEHPFQLLKSKLLKELIQKSPPGRPLSIWSAACSTGQELVSIQVILKELSSSSENPYHQLNLFQPQILGTDICKSSIQQAKEGLYNEYEMTRGLSEAQKRLYFDFDETTRQWKVKGLDQIKVKFVHFNLLDSWGWIPSMDLIFCRNVLIYFESSKSKDILALLARKLKPNGILFLGSMENPGTLPTGLVRHKIGRTTYFQKVSTS